MKEKVGDVRIVKSDPLNYAIQVYRERQSRATGEKYYEWVEEAYFGHHFDWATRAALMSGVPEKSDLIGEFSRAAEQIIAATLAHVGEIHTDPAEAVATKEVEDSTDQPNVERKRGRGRPPGAKNKPKGSR